MKYNRSDFLKRAMAGAAATGLGGTGLVWPHTDWSSVAAYWE